MKVKITTLGVCRNGVEMWRWVYWAGQACTSLNNFLGEKLTVCDVRNLPYIDKTDNPFP